MSGKYYVYIMTNRYNNVLYTGVTNNLRRRVREHISGEIGDFSRKYKVKKLVYFEAYENVIDAIEREKRIKGGSRIKKIRLISEMNEDWMDLANCIQ